MTLENYIFEIIATCVKTERQLKLALSLQMSVWVWLETDDRVPI